MDFKLPGSKLQSTSGTGPLSLPTNRFNTRPGQIELGSGFRVQSKLLETSGQTANQTSFNQSNLSLGSAYPTSSILNPPNFNPSALAFERTAAADELLKANQSASFARKGHVDGDHIDPLSYTFEQLLTYRTYTESNEIYSAICQAQRALGENPENIKEINQSLQKIGLMLYDGKIINLAKSRNLNLDDPASLSQLVTVNFKDMERLKQVIIANQNKLAHSANDFRANHLSILSPPVVSIAERFADNAVLRSVNLGKITSQPKPDAMFSVFEITQAVSKLTSKLNKLIEDAEENNKKQVAVEQRIQQTQKRVTDGQTQINQIQDVLNKIPHGINQNNLDEINQLLEKISTIPRLSIVMTDSGPQFMVGNQVAGSEQFKAALTKINDTYSSNLQKDVQDLKAYESELQQILQVGQKIKADIDKTSGELDEHLQILDEVRIASERGVDELLKIKNDPVKWNQLKPDEKELIEKEIARLRSEIAKANAVKQEAQNTRERARKAVEKLEQNARRGDAVLKRSGQFWEALSKLKIDYSKLMKLPKSEVSSELDTKLKTFSELIKDADELAGRLTLSPVPQGDELKALEDKWQDLLEQTATQFVRQTHSSQQLEAGERQRMEEAAKLIRENLDYHQGKLEQLAEGQKERVALLLESLQRFQISLAQ